jgi:hypothetical protein
MYTVKYEKSSKREKKKNSEVLYSKADVIVQSVAINLFHEIQAEKKSFGKKNSHSIFEV